MFIAQPKTFNISLMNEIEFDHKYAFYTRIVI